MHIRYPHCHNAIEVVEDLLPEGSGVPELRKLVTSILQGTARPAIGFLSTLLSSKLVKRCY